MRDYRGYREPYSGHARGSGMGGEERPYDVGYRSEFRGGRHGGGWSGGPNDRMGGARGRAMGGRERMTFGPRHEHEYDRDMGDQLREGWRELKRGVRNAFGGSGGYDRGWRGTPRHRHEGWSGDAGYDTRPPGGWPGYYERGEAGGRFETRGRYGGDYLW